MDENKELLTKVLVAWNFRYAEGTAMVQDPEYNGQSFIAKILRKKIEVFKIPIKVPDHLLMIIELCTESNPGISQILLKEIMKSIPGLSAGHEITPMDFAIKYAMAFPEMSNPKFEQEFRKLWDEQKDPDTGANLCDTPAWWMECFEVI